MLRRLGIGFALVICGFTGSGLGAEDQKVVVAQQPIRRAH